MLSPLPVFTHWSRHCAYLHTNLQDICQIFTEVLRQPELSTC